MQVTEIRIVLPFNRISTRQLQRLRELNEEVLDSF
jgi:hypothetical protein